VQASSMNPAKTFYYSKEKLPCNNTHTHKLRKKLDDFIISQKKVPR
jgi:hypothetical protein